MKKCGRIKNLLCFIFSFLLLLPHSPTAASTTYNATDEQLTMLESNLDVLEQNNKTLSAILAEQERELRTAREQSERQSKTLAKLQQDLTEVSQEISAAKTSLETASEELKAANVSLTKLEKEKASYRRKSKFWRTLAFVFLGAAGIAAAS